MPFIDIFSKKTEKTKKIDIVVDNREKNSLVPSKLIEKGFLLNWQQLQIGDYIIGSKIIERKTFSDLQASIINKRIFDQLNQLSNYDYLLIIESDDSNLFIHENALRGFFLFLSESKIPYLLSSSSEETASFILLLSKTRKSNQSIRPFRTLKNKSEYQQFILEGFPGIGAVTAKKLLNKFNSLEAVFSASEDSLIPILGKKAIAFKELLR